MIFECRLCGASVMGASNRGAFLKRVNAKGQPPIMECSPSCDSKGTQDEAVINAILGDAERELEK